MTRWGATVAGRGPRDPRGRVGHPVRLPHRARHHAAAPALHVGAARPRPPPARADRHARPSRPGELVIRPHAPAPGGDGWTPVDEHPDRPGARRSAAASRPATASTCSSPVIRRCRSSSPMPTSSPSTRGPRRDRRVGEPVHRHHRGRPPVSRSWSRRRSPTASSPSPAPRARSSQGTAPQALDRVSAPAAVRP